MRDLPAWTLRLIGEFGMIHFRDPLRRRDRGGYEPVANFLVFCEGRSPGRVTGLHVFRPIRCLLRRVLDQLDQLDVDQSPETMAWVLSSP